MGSRAGEFVDTARDRKIPYRIYHPQPLQGRYPVILVSHGLGGSREGNEQLGRHLAANDFVVVHIQHPGSDESVYRGARDRRGVQVRLAQSLRAPSNASNRFLDVPFAISQLANMNESDRELKGHLDLAALGMAGHSYGAISTMVAAGERVGLQYQSVRVPTLRAGLILSPSPPRDAEAAYRDVATPLFHMTGTEDESLLDARAVSAADRTKPYRLLTLPNQYLLVLDKADHVTFSGRRLGTREENSLDRKHMAAVLTGALAFFRAYLTENKEAATWLRTEYKGTLDPTDVFEFK